MKQDIEKVLISKEEIQKRVKELGAQLTEDYKDKNPLIVGILKGSFIFMSDLVRNIDCVCTVDFMATSSYGASTTSSGSVKIIKDVDTNIEGRHVIICEDIVDTGFTLSKVLELFKARRPASLKLCTLLSKPSRRKVDVKIDYCGFEVPDEFVIGYGFDYDGIYRNLNEICVLKPEVYSK